MTTKIANSKAVIQRAKKALTHHLLIKDMKLYMKNVIKKPMKNPVTL